MSCKRPPSASDLDYSKTFNHAMKPIPIRVHLTFSQVYGWIIRKIGINNAFLHCLLTKFVYMEQLASFHI